jgi:hypothetical protein
LTSFASTSEPSRIFRNSAGTKFLSVGYLPSKYRAPSVLPSFAGGNTIGIKSMTQLEIDALEHAGRSAFAWSPEGYDGRIHYAAVFGALLPALGILAVAAAFLFIAF